MRKLLIALFVAVVLSGVAAHVAAAECCMLEDGFGGCLIPCP